MLTEAVPLFQRLDKQCGRDLQAARLSLGGKRMVSSYTKDFGVEWKDPADAGLTRLYDPMHAPDPVCQANGEFWDRMYGKYMSCRNTYVNRYAFSTQPTPRPPTPEILERGVLDVWTTDYLPEITSACDRIRSKNYDAMSLAELGDAIDGIVAEAVHAFGFTTKPITG